jgi:prepilin peptidase CpaA
MPGPTTTPVTGELVLPTFNPIVVAAVAGAGAASAAVDMRVRRVPNVLTFGIAGMGVALALVRLTPVGLAGALAGLGIGLVLMLPGHVIGATGAGDVKLFAALGTLLGPARTGMAFIYMALIGAALALVVAQRRGRLRTTLDCAVEVVRTGGAAAAEIERPEHNNRFAYAPAIALGAFAAALGL